LEGLGIVFVASPGIPWGAPEFALDLQELALDDVVAGLDRHGWLILVVGMDGLLPYVRDEDIDEGIGDIVVFGGPDMGELVDEGLQVGAVVNETGVALHDEADSGTDTNGLALTGAGERENLWDTKARGGDDVLQMEPKSPYLTSHFFVVGNATNPDAADSEIHKSIDQLGTEVFDVPAIRALDGVEMNSGVLDGRELRAGNEQFFELSPGDFHVLPGGGVTHHLSCVLRGITLLVVEKGGVIPEFGEDRTALGEL
jgi:hypothetical protein